MGNNKERIQINTYMHVYGICHSVVFDSLKPYELQPTRLLCPWRFSRQEYQNGLPCPPPGDLPDPATEVRSPALQMDSLPAELPVKSNYQVTGTNFTINIVMSILIPIQKMRQKYLLIRAVFHFFPQVSIYISQQFILVQCRKL